jgi:hypothetical protein
MYTSMSTPRALGANSKDRGVTLLHIHNKEIKPTFNVRNTILSIIITTCARQRPQQV